MARHLLSVLVFAPLLSACSTPAPPPSSGTAPSSTAASALPVTTATTEPTAAATATAAASGGPTARDEPQPSEAPNASAVGSAAPEAPIPNVKVANIGMHIGGGPHDAVTKAPIKTSVEPHFDELRKCWAKVDDPKKGGDFGLDLLIDRAGGKAKVSHPRTSLKGAGFKECLVAVFEAIDFKKPRGGTTTVSYSVRFTP